MISMPVNMAANTNAMKLTKRSTRERKRNTMIMVLANPIKQRKMDVIDLGQEIDVDKLVNWLERLEKL